MDKSIFDIKNGTNLFNFSCFQVYTKVYIDKLRVTAIEMAGKVSFFLVAL